MYRENGATSRSLPISRTGGLLFTRRRSDSLAGTSISPVLCSRARDLSPKASGRSLFPRYCKYPIVPRRYRASKARLFRRLAYSRRLHGVSRRSRQLRFRFSARNSHILSHARKKQFQLRNRLQYPAARRDCRASKLWTYISNASRVGQADALRNAPLLSILGEKRLTLSRQAILETPPRMA